MTEPLTWNSAYSHDEPTPIYDETVEAMREHSPDFIIRVVYPWSDRFAEFFKACWPADRLLQLMMGGFLLLAAVCLIAAGFLR